MVWDLVAEFRVARQELFKTDYTTYRYYIRETSTLGALPPREASKQRAGSNVAEAETQRSIVVLFIQPLQPSYSPCDIPRLPAVSCVQCTLLSMFSVCHTH